MSHVPIRFSRTTVSKPFAEMSSAGVMYCPPALLTSVSSRRPVITTVAPSALSSCAVARPRPEPPPVTTATCPCKSPGAKMRDGMAAATIAVIYPSNPHRTTGFKEKLAPLERHLATAARGRPARRDRGSLGDSLQGREHRHRRPPDAHDVRRRDPVRAVH